MTKGLALATVQPTIDIDAAFERFKLIRDSVPPEDDKPISDNEACTRTRLIDPILFEVLGWPRWKAGFEEKAGEGRLDYILRDHHNINWFVIEAKKRDLELVERIGHSGKKFKLGGPVFQKQSWPIIKDQMSEYLGRFMPCFGGLTNGEQWIGFLGRLRPEAMIFEETRAVVFRSLDDIESNFLDFYQFFGMQGAQHKRLLHFLAPNSARAVVHCPSPKRVVHPDYEKPLSYQDEDKEFLHDLRQALEAAFSPIQNDPDALAKCFVESKESEDADSRLKRLASELRQTLLTADEYPDMVEGEVRETQLVSLSGGRDFTGHGVIARLLGESSSGKTVFLKRFYETVLGADRRNIILIWIDCESFLPFDPKVANADALEQVKTELFREEGPEWAHVREIYRRDWERLTKLLGRDKEDLKLREQFVRERLAEEANDPGTVLFNYCDFAVRNRRKLPCIVIDNIDHHPQVAEIIRWAVSMHLNTYALTTVALEDATLWKLRRNENDQLAKHNPEQFWLYRPKVGEVLENRCDYLKTVLANRESDHNTTETRIGRTRMWRWTTNPEELVKIVSIVLLEDAWVANTIGQLCNYDIRQVLEVCKQIVLSPHVKARDLLKTQVTGQSIYRWQVLKAIIAPSSQQFRGLPTDPVMNVFGLWLGDDWAPMLPARILALLRHREDAERGRREEFAGFLAVEKIQQLLDRHLSIPIGVTLSALDTMRTIELVETFDPSRVNLDEQGAKIRISPRGRLLLDFARYEQDYVRMMAEVDPIVDPNVLRKLREKWQGFLGALGKGDVRNIKEGTTEMISVYVEYALDQARKVSPLAPELTDLDPIRSFENELRNKWCYSSY